MRLRRNPGRRSSGSLLAFLLLNAACGGATPPPEVVQPEPSSQPPVVVAPAPAVSSATPAAKPLKVPTGPADFKLAWVASAGDWNRGLAISPSGDVLAVGSDGITVLAGDTGRFLVSAPLACRVNLANSLFFLEERRALLVCDHAVLEIEIPSLKQREVLSYPSSQIKAASYAAGRLALGGEIDRSFKVHIINTAALSVQAETVVPAKVESLALSRDGSRLVVGLEDGTLEVWSVGGGSSVVKLPKGGRRITALAVAPEGAEFFANDGIFKARTYALQGGAAKREHSVGSWINTAVYLTPALIAVAGSDGLQLLVPGQDRPAPLPGPEEIQSATGEGIAANAQGSMLCSGDRRNHIFCYATGDLPKSTFQPFDTPATSTATAPTTSSSPPPALSKKEYEGTIVRRAGNTLTLQLATLPTAGVQGSLYRKFLQTFGTMKVTGWLEIAEVRVRKVDARGAEVEILKEKSDIRINNQKVDHFGIGETIKLQTK